MASVVFNRQSLLSALSKSSGAINSTGKSSILKNFKLTVKGDGTATVEATDQETGIRVAIEGVVGKKAFSCLLPQKVLMILKELRSDDVEIEFTASGVNITSGFSEFKLATEDATLFPAIRSFDSQSYYSVESNWMADSSVKVAFSCDAESTRYALSGVLFDIDASGKLTLAATDSRRLAVITGPMAAVGVPHAPTSQIVVPQKAVLILGRNCEATGTVHMSVTETDVIFQTGAVTIYSRLVEGRFPRYSDVIPKEVNSTATFTAGPVASAIRQSMIVASAESRGTDFDFSNGNLTLKTVGADIGNSTISVPVSIEGDGVQTTLEGKFITQFLSTLDDVEPVTAKLIDGYSAVVFVSGTYTYVVMPLSKD